MSLDVTTGTRKAVAAVLFAACCGVIVAVALVLREHGPGNMGNGMLVGAGVGGDVVVPGPVLVPAPVPVPVPSVHAERVRAAARPTAARERFRFMMFRSFSAR